MTPFQWMAGSLLVAALLAEFALQVAGKTSRRISWTRSIVWAGALTLLLYPNVLQDAAVRLQIGRGADFLLYLMALSFPIVCFYFLHAIEKQRRQITHLVRALAERQPLHEPTQPAEFGDNSDVSPSSSTTPGA